jgi:very-short-patch-repair endonuclease
MCWEERFRALAHRQQGLVARLHLPLLGCTRHHWRRARESGRWDTLGPRVLRLRGTPESNAQRALAAVLDASPGGMLHGRSALAWWGLRGYDLRTIHVARPRHMSGTGAHLAKLHLLRDVRTHDVVVARGVPTETALRAIWTEAARYAPEPLFEIGCRKIGRLLDEAHVHGLVTWAALDEMVTDIRERGRSGTTVMKTLAEARPPGSSPTESSNEDRLEKVLAGAGKSPLRRQPVVGGHEPIGRADFRDPDLPLVVEVNSLAFHTTPSDREADKLRYQRFNDAGFLVAVIWENDLWSRPTAVVETLTEARRRAEAGDRVVLHSPSCPWPSGSGY